MLPKRLFAKCLCADIRVVVLSINFADRDDSSSVALSDVVVSDLAVLLLAWRCRATRANE